MYSGLFEPLYGKNQEAVSKPLPQDSNLEAKPATKTSQKSPLEGLSEQFASKKELGSLFQEMDQSKFLILVLSIALIIVFIMLLVMNSRQKTQRRNLSTLQKRLKRLQSK